MLPNFMIDKDNYIFGGGTSHSLRLKKEGYSDRYVLGVLNSRLMQYIIYDLCPVKMGNARKYGLDYIKKLPIKKGDEKTQNVVQKLVDQILSLKKDNPKADTSDLEREIDLMVYELYGLSKEEIEIVENS